MDLNGETVIRRSPEEVFAYVMDLSNDANWRTGIDESGLRPGQELGPGAAGYSRAGDQEVEWRVVSYTPDESVSWELLNGPFMGRGGYWVMAVEGGTPIHACFQCGTCGCLQAVGTCLQLDGPAPQPGRRRETKRDLGKTIVKVQAGKTNLVLSILAEEKLRCTWNQRRLSVRI